jgi:hypothetical protein
MFRLSFLGKRILIGVVLLVTIFVTLNHLLEWRIFGAEGKRVMICCYVALAFAIYTWLPTSAEWDEYRKQTDRAP